MAHKYWIIENCNNSNNNYHVFCVDSPGSINLDVYSTILSHV